MPLSEKVKEEIRAILKTDPLRGISLTKLETGDIQITVISSSIWDESLKKYLKKGFIPTKVYDENKDIIIKWEVVKENIEDYTKEANDLKEAISDYLDTLNKIETDPFYGRIYANSVPNFLRRKNQAETELRMVETSLEKSRQEFPELKNKIATLRNFEYLRENKYI
jgi:hypothetical protein